MKRIAILGCENSHANNFLKAIRENEEYSDYEVVGIYSDEAEATEKLNAEYGVPVMASFDEAVGRVDGLIITARHGKNHYKYAEPYIKSGIPMFIDKPITVDCGEAQIAEIFKAHSEYAKGDFYVTLEPHLQTFSGLHALVGKSFDNPYKFETQEAAFAVAVSKIKEIIA